MKEEKRPRATKKVQRPRVGFRRCSANCAAKEKRPPAMLAEPSAWNRSTRERNIFRECLLMTDITLRRPKLMILAVRTARAGIPGMDSRRTRHVAPGPRMCAESLIQRRVFHYFLWK